MTTIEYSEYKILRTKSRSQQRMLKINNLNEYNNFIKRKNDLHHLWLESEYNNNKPSLKKIKSIKVLNTPKEIKYKKYINSLEWSEISRSIRLQRKSCELCDSDLNLVVHHISYHILAKESNEMIQNNWLLCCCNWCHKAIHENNMFMCIDPMKNNKTVDRLTFLTDYKDLIAKFKAN